MQSLIPIVAVRNRALMKCRRILTERQRVEQNNPRPQRTDEAASAPANHREIAGGSFVVGNADITTIITASGNGCLPELDFLEVIKAVGGAAGVSQQFITLASGGYGWY